MVLKILPLTILMLTLMACTATGKRAALTVEGQHAAANDTKASQRSYALGLLHIKTLRDGKFDLDQGAYERGLTDAINGKNAAESLDEGNTKTNWLNFAKLSNQEVRAANLAVGKTFLEQNKSRPEVTTLPSGVQYEVLQKSNSPHKPTMSDTVGVIYKISGIDGTVKADYFTKGNQKMFEIPMQKMTSEGWQELLQLMSKDSKWRLYIPGNLAFGEKGLREKGILPNEALIIDCLLLDIKIGQ